jgi:hypothetical protein
VSVTLDWSRYLFINVDLTVHLHRMPVAEWVCLDAETFPEPTGVGMADSRLLDESGHRPGRSDLAGGQARGNRLRDAQLFGGSGAKHPFQ